VGSGAVVQTASQPLVGTSWSKIATVAIRLKTGLRTINERREHR